MKTLALGCMVTLLAAPAAAQGHADPRWSAWLGCWELVNDDTREDPAAPGIPASRPGTARPRARTQPADAARPRLCVEPAREAGVIMRTIIGGQTAVEQTIVADGRDRPIDETGCRGTHRAEWSDDGRRLFTHAELACAGEAPRSVTGLTLIARDGTWLDIQALRIDARESIRVRRYRRADDQPRTGAALTLDDVSEASARISPRALEAALVETNAAFTLSSRRLIALDEAGVPESVIDLIVALSYPQKFIVERQARSSLPPVVLGDPFWPYLYGWDFAYSPYAYAPFAYSSLGARGSWLFGPGVIVIDGAGISQPGRQLDGAGLAVNHLGYTRVRPREAADTRSAGSSGQRAASIAGTGSSASGTGSTSGSSVSAPGYSSGGSGSSGGGRTAVPR